MEMKMAICCAILSLFFFQAEDGIRDLTVTGVQTCALPISNVVLLNPGRGGPAAVEEQWVDESNAGDRLGVSPARVVDYLALVGDTSDNIPGEIGRAWGRGRV